MFQPLSKAIEAQPSKRVWDESDVRHFIQQWLRAETGIGQVYCESFRGGVATVRASSPAVRMTVRLLEYDLRQALKKVGEQKLRGVKVEW